MAYNITINLDGGSDRHYSIKSYEINENDEFVVIKSNNQQFTNKDLPENWLSIKFYRENQEFKCILNPKYWTY